MLRSYFSGILLWILFCAQAPSIPQLAPGVSLVQDLAPAASHTYGVELVGAGTWRVEVDQHDLDVVVTVWDPQGEMLVAVDSPFDRQGRESALFETAGVGRYRVEVRAREAVAVPGHYEVRLDPVLDARQRAAAAAATEGSRLYLEGTPEAWRRALDANARAFEAWEELGDLRAAARALYSNAVLHRLLDETRRALEVSLEVLPLWRKEGDLIFTANTLNEIGLGHWQLGEILEARSFFTRARARHEEAGHGWGVAEVSANLCLMDLMEGDLRTGAQCFEQTLTRLEEVQALDLASTAAANAGRAWNLLGEPEKALASYAKALAFARTLGDRGAEARALNNLGFLQREIGEFHEALAGFDEALQIFREAGRRRWQAHVLNNIGAAYQTLGQFDQALVHYRQALDLSRELENPRGEATNLVNLGLVHRKMEQPVEARDFLTQALAVWRTLGDRREEALTLGHLGRIALDRKESETAALFLGQAVSTLREVGDRIHETAALTDLGMAWNALGQLDEAREHLRRALDLGRELGALGSEVRSLAALARTERLAGDPARARELVETAIRLVERERLEVGPPALRASFASTFHDLYELQLDLLLSADDVRGALEASERTRARTLLELLKESGVDLYQDADPELLARRRSLQRRLDAKAERATRAATGPAQQTALGEEQAVILRELDAVESMLRRDVPPEAVRPVTVAEMQALLDEDTVLLVFSLGTTRSVLWRVDPVSVTAHELPPRQEVEAVARRVHANLQRFDPSARHHDARAAAELANLLLGLVATRLDAVRLVVVPDGALFYIPFEVLPLPQQDGGAPKPLLDRYEIAYLPSASALAAQRRTVAKPPPAPRFLAVLADPVFDRSDPRLGATGTGGTAGLAGTAGAARARSGTPSLERLPATRREAEAITALAPPGETFVAFGFDAARHRVLGASLSSYRYLHFATHGVIDTETPALSGLVLSLYDREARPQEGFLRLHDIYGLRLDADLVVLSGCRTALGRQIRGEGLWGLTRGFLAAGARRVIASLWQVEDQATAELMRHFYTALWEEGKSPAAALRSAKFALRRERRWRAPHFWAGFVLEGDWR